MAKPTLRLVAPTTENRTIGPRRPKNAELRTREHLTPDEAELLIEAAKLSFSAVSRLIAGATARQFDPDRTVPSRSINRPGFRWAKQNG
jgi:hypothetical protein